MNGEVNISKITGTSIPAPGVPNIGCHALGVFDLATGASLLPTHEPTPTVDMKTCATDALGFCWTAPLTTPLVLAPGQSYIVASSEDGVDAYAEMTDPATGTKMGHRIVRPLRMDATFLVCDRHCLLLMVSRDDSWQGTTYMSYQTPGGIHAPAVTGRAFRNGDSGPFQVTHEIDTSFGPVNFQLAGVQGN